MSAVKVLSIDLGQSCFHVIGRDFSYNQVILRTFSCSVLLNYFNS